MRTNKRVAILIAVILISLFPVYHLLTKGKPAVPVMKEVAPVNQVLGIEALEKAVISNPNFDNLLNLSKAYLDNQLPGKSIDYLNRAILLQPNSCTAYNNLGVARNLLSQFGEGEKALRKALEIDSTYQLAKNNLKWALDEKNKILFTIASQEQIVDSKRTLSAELERGLNYFKIADYDKSISVWENIVKKDPKNLQALNNIGTSFMMKGQIDEAIAIYTKILAITPNDQLAKNNLIWAQGEKK